MSDTKPFIYFETVHPDWIDYNGHMNVAYYVLVFDHATDALLDAIGLGTDYRAETGHSSFVVESHIRYLGEVHEGERLRVESALVDFDPKRILLHHQMFRDGAEEKPPVATIEVLLVNIDMTKRKAAIIPESHTNKLMTASRHRQNPSFPATLRLGLPRQKGETGAKQ